VGSYSFIHHGSWYISYSNTVNVSCPKMYVPGRTMSMLYIVIAGEYEWYKVPRYLCKAAVCAGTCECSNEHSGSIKCWEFLD
jgi:hypothetical protein